VLRYLQSMLSNEEIAAKLFVSINTVKTHVRHIYRKLDVSHRRDAVRRARELRLL
jgi:LuxR family maltose regulon positive regulatory protein